MTSMQIRGVSLDVNVVGSGPPLVLMHGGPGADQWTLLPFRSLADRFTLVFYDHRCNGRSTGAPVETMTWDNLTADADALREQLGFERWAVLGHSFGGHVALEYALRYPDRVSRLVLLDTAADGRWAQENAPRLLARRGFDARTVRRARRLLTGQIPPETMFRTMIRLGDAYHHRRGLSLLRLMVADLIRGEWRSRLRPEAIIWAAPNLTRDWTVVDRLGEIRIPTLVMAGRDDFQFPPECQAVLAAGIPGAELEIVEKAGHNPHSEERAVVMAAVSEFLLRGSAAVPEPPVAVSEAEKPRQELVGVA